VRESDGKLIMSKQLPRKFLVVSYDDDQQQWFWDYVAATTGEAAVALVCKRRPYVIAADAASPSQVQDIADSLKRRPVSRITDRFNWGTMPPKKKRKL
jgi:3-hydroxy-3-methylglutaryl CoA synthase